jgi:hypothetical protein
VLKERYSSVAGRSDKGGAFEVLFSVGAGRYYWFYFDIASVA